MYWFDGRVENSSHIQLEVNAPGLCYGASVFSTMRVYEQSLDHPLTAWQAHCNRLKSSLESFHWQQPNWRRLETGAKELSKHFPVLRMTVFPDGKEWILGRNLPADLEQRQTEGIITWIARENLYVRELAQHKTGNYLGAYLAKNRALNFKAQEAILVDRWGSWLETSTGNLWGWRDGCWYTPSLASGILPGIRRSHLLKSLRNNGYLVRENIWDNDFVSTLEAISYCNCVIEAIPIKQAIDSDRTSSYEIVPLPN